MAQIAAKDAAFIFSVEFPMALCRYAFGICNWKVE